MRSTANTRHDRLGTTGFPVPRRSACAKTRCHRHEVLRDGMADGRSLWNGALPDDLDERRAHLPRADRHDGQLHLNRPEEIGLGEYGKPGDYCARQIARWSKQYQLSETADHRDGTSSSTGCRDDSRHSTMCRSCTAITGSTIWCCMPTSRGSPPCSTGSCRRSAIRWATSPII